MMTVVEQPATVFNNDDVSNVMNNNSFIMFQYNKQYSLSITKGRKILKEHGSELKGLQT